jgi:hypothetical protein
MADTNHDHATPAGSLPVEGDGINYGGIGWFVVVLVITTAFCQVLMWGMFRLMENRADAADAAAPRSALAVPVGTLPAPPNLLLDEPASLADYQVSEELRMTTYGWFDQNTGQVRIPIERAKELLLERGLPVRGQQQEPQ